MPYVIVENFKGGLDSRRSVLASAPGTLSKAQNVHISRGGELEKRKAFVAVDAGVDTEHTHPFEGTYGLESTNEGATVFTTSYATTSWFNPGKWVRFLWLNITDEAEPVQPAKPDKMYVRFQYHSTIHEISVPNLSIANDRIQIPGDSKQIDVSFDAPISGMLVNYFTANIPSGTNELILVATSDGSTNAARCFSMNISTLEKYGFMVLNYTDRTVSGKLGNNAVSAPPLQPWPKQPSYWAAPATYNSNYNVSLSVSGGTGPSGQFISSTWLVESTNIMVVRKNGSHPLKVHSFSVPDTYNRVNLKTRIQTVYSDIKVVELDHPDGVELVGIVYSTVYGGKSFVLAKFANGDVLPFYDGKVVGAFVDGIYRESFGGLYRFIESISGLMKDGFSIAQENFLLDSTNDEQIREYSVSTVETVNGTSMTITGPSRAVDYTVKAYIDGPCAYTIETVQEAKDEVASTSATASFTISGGSPGSASCGATLRQLNGYDVPPITGIFIAPVSGSAANGEEITGIDRSSPTPIAWPYTGYTSGDAWDAGQKLCYAIAYVVNTNTINTRISAAYANYGGGWHGADPGSFYISTTPKRGAAYNGRQVWFEFSSIPNSGNSNMGQLIDVSTIQVSPYDSSRFVAAMAGGALQNGVANSISSIVSNGVELLSDIDPDTNTTKPDKAQYFDSTNEQLAVDVVSSINAGFGTHGHVASRDGSRVTITAPAGLGLSGNSKPIHIATTGNVLLTAKTGFTGGRDSIAGFPKIVRINFTGTPDVGDKCWVSITDPERPDMPYKFGSTRMSGKKGSFCFTYKGKEYIGVDSTLYFSSLNSAVKWDVYDTGSGFIDMSNNFGGRESLTGAGVYQNSIAVFTERHCQLWFFDPDPTLNSQHQVLDNTGCIAPNSVVSVGAVDLFYLSYNGVRSLQSRENTDSACANDIGSAIDEIIISLLSTLTPEQRAAAKAIIEPTDGRYWISIGSKLFVLSYFRGSSILAWSEYVTGFDIDEMVVFKGKVYVRSGQKIYLYGGNSGNQYDSSPIVVELPYLDANKPAGYKQVVGIDATCEGQWTFELGFDYTNPSQRDTVAIISQPTFALGRIMATGIGTHIGPRLTSSYDGYCRLANLIVHYDDMHSKHEG